MDGEVPENNMIQETLKKYIEEIVQKLFNREVVFTLEHPKEMAYGDFASNVALEIVASYRKNLKIHKEKGLDFEDSVSFGHDVRSSLGLEMYDNPVKIAQLIKDEMSKNIPNDIEKIEIAGPGFINFTLHKQFFVEKIQTILAQKETYGISEIYKNKKILIEHSSPNLFKPFHIGHFMNNAIGESLVRLARASGADIRTMSFPSDISLGVAKALFVLEKNGNPPFDISVAGQAYVEGTKVYEEDETTHARIKEIADNIYNNVPSPELDVYNHYKLSNIVYFEKITARLGSHFDSYVYESEAGIDGKHLVQKYTPAIFTESEGAIVYVPEENKKHLNTAVFINSQGNPTYEAKDLGLLEMKFNREQPDVSLFVTDYQQVPHFQIVLDVAEKINARWVQNSIHIPHGRMSFKGQKMSSRLGGVPLVETLIDTVIEAVAEKAPELSESTKEQIAIGALKFVILRTTAGKNINFDPDTSLSFEGDSGPYLQYTAVRARSIIEKAESQNETFDFNTAGNTIVLPIEKMLARFPEIIDYTISEWAPHHLVGYLLELAQTFNSWYAHTKIIDSENEQQSYNIATTKAFYQTMKNGLAMLAIDIPDKM